MSAKWPAPRLAHVSLELGGKSPSIIFADAATPDRIDATVDGVLTAMRFTRQGQSCTAGSRLFVHSDVYEAVLDKLVEKVSALVVGDPLDEATDMGSIINESQYRQVRDYVDEGKAQPGVSVALDGRGFSRDGLDGLLPGARPSWPASTTAGGWPARRSSARCWW